MSHQFEKEDREKILESRLTFEYWEEYAVTYIGEYEEIETQKVFPLKFYGTTVFNLGLEKEMTLRDLFENTRYGKLYMIGNEYDDRGEMID